MKDIDAFNFITEITFSPRQQRKAIEETILIAVHSSIDTQISKQRERERERKRLREREKRKEIFHYVD